MKRALIPTEDSEQIWLFEWADRAAAARPELRWLFHVPNGGSRNKIEAAKLKRMGVKSGVPDIFLDIPRGGYHGLRIELKRVRDGYTRDTQREWLEQYAREGYRAVVCHGWDEARAEIERYLEG